MLFNEILSEVGDRGPYQNWLLYALWIPLTMLCAMNGYATVFMVYSPDHWCYVEQLSNLSMEEQHDLIRPVTMYRGVKKFDSCLMYDIDYDEVGKTLKLPGDPASLKTKKCPNGWTFDRTTFWETSVTELKLVCDDKTKVSHILSTTKFASILGEPLGGWVSDRFGRKKGFFYGIFLFVVSAFISPIILRDYTSWIVARVFKSLHSAFSTGMILVLELCAPSIRTRSSVIGQIFWPVSLVILTIYAYLVPDWIWICLLPTLLVLPYLLIYKWVPESPSWLISRKKYSEAHKLLEKIAKANGKEVPHDLMDKIKKVGSEKSGDNEETDKISIFQSRKLIIYTFIFVFAFMANTVAIFGLNLNTLNYKGNFFINTVLVGSFQVPGLLFSWWAIETRFGRRWTNCLCMLLSGIALSIPALLPVENELVTTVFSLIGKFGISASYAIVLQQSKEIYPTNIRVRSISVCRAIAQLFAIGVPYISVLGEYGLGIPLIIYGTICIVSSVLQAFLPETLNEPMPQTIQDSENIGKGMKFLSLAK